MLPEVLSAAQLGSRLRVLVADRIEHPDVWLKAQPPTDRITDIQQVRPNLEDVFVTCTGEGPQ